MPMTFKTTLSFTDRHHLFLSEKVSEGVYATQSAAVAAAIEQMIQDEAEREVALKALLLKRYAPACTRHVRSS